MAGIKILGLGKSRGDLMVTNDQMAEVVDTSDQWIREKSGIRSRYFARERSNADMATEAAEAAIAAAGVSKENIAFCIVCTFTPDDDTPAVACTVAGRLGLPEHVMALDLNGACSGFIYGCNIANGLLGAMAMGEASAAASGSPAQSKASGPCPENNAFDRRPGNKACGLIIGSERISPVMDMEDRSTCVLFGDGSGAAVVQWDENGEFLFRGGCLPDREVLHCSRGGYIKMGGQEVYRFAVSKVPQVIEEVLAAGGRTEEDVDYFVCHQANERIIDNVARRIQKKGKDGKHTEKNKFFKNLYSYGNTSAASIPIALCEMEEQGLLQPGMRLVCTGFGAGLTYGCMMMTVG